MVGPFGTFGAHGGAFSKARIVFSRWCRPVLDRDDRFVTGTEIGQSTDPTSSNDPMHRFFLSGSFIIWPLLIVLRSQQALKGVAKSPFRILVGAFGSVDPTFSDRR